MVVLFANGRGKRLGDLAAGTIVVKDSDYVALWQLPGGRPFVAQPGSGPHPPPPAPMPVVSPASAAEVFLRRIDPDLRRFVSSYLRRRPELPLEVRAQLATQLQPSLQQAVPEIFAEHGPLATLDYLADLERG
jgi:hypothetical protein